MKVGCNNKINFKGETMSKSNTSLKTNHDHVYEVTCFDKNGNQKWVDYIFNTVVNEGLDDILTQYYKGSSYTAAHYVGLTGTTPTFASDDTIGGTHAGWTEVTAYTETNRPDFTAGSVSGQSVDNSSSKASVTINSDGTTIGGAFLVTDNTKDGTSGALVGGGAFSGGDKTIGDGDTLSVQVTANASSS